MDTKRCPYCHKLQRADARQCSRCGHTFLPKRQSHHAGEEGSLSLPPASPHLAGHHVGLHPEDQPFMSGKIVVQPGSLQEEVEDDDESWIAALPEPASIQLPVPVAERAAETRRQPERQTTRRLAPVQVERSVRQTRRLKQVQTQPPVKSVAPLAAKSIPVLPTFVTLACLALLLVSSVVAFALIGNHPSVATAGLSVSPAGPLRVGDTFSLAGNGFGVHHLITITYDNNKTLLDGNNRPLQAHTDERGDFSLQIKIPEVWVVGQHSIYALDLAQSLSASTQIMVQQAPSTPSRLQLSKQTLTFSTSTATQQPLTLINAGGGEIHWQMSSDQAWLTAAPGKGVFAGKQSVVIEVNRGTLQPKTYEGHITFTQNDHPGDVSQILTVTMDVKPAATGLLLTKTTLGYTASAGANPAIQTVVLQNSGEQTVNWTSYAGTGDGSNWLTISPSEGRLRGHSAAIIQVQVQSQSLAVGSYQGTVLFHGNSTLQLNVTLDVITGGNLVASPSALTLTAAPGQKTVTGSVNLQNSGGTGLDWTTTLQTHDNGNWLSVSPASGTLAADQQIAVTITVNPAALSAGGYQGTVTFNGGSSSTQVAISLTVAVPPAPVINIQNTSLSFTTYKGSTPNAQTVALTNSGNATLNWVAAVSGASNLFSVSPSSGILAPAQRIQLTVTPTLDGVAGGNYPAVITISDSDAGTTVVGQKIAVSGVVIDQAAIGVSASSLVYNQDRVSSSTTTQLLTIRNTGSEVLNWQVTQSGGTVPWLTLDLQSGVLDPGESFLLGVTCDSSALAPGTYKVTLVISDSDAGTPVASQTVQITLVVV